MDLKEPVRKRTPSHITVKACLPILLKNESGLLAGEGLWGTYSGNFNGFSVVIDDPQEMKALYDMGFFGKGSLSRGYPSFGTRKKGVPPILKEHQWKRRQEWVRRLNEQAELGEGPSNGEVAQELGEKMKEQDEGGGDCEIVVLEPEENGVEENEGLKRNRGDATSPDENPAKKVRSEEVTEESVGSVKENPRTLEIVKGEGKQVFVYSNSKGLEDIESSLRLERETIETVVEELHLTLEEAFFLSFGLGCLEVADLDGHLLSLLDMWHLFRQTQNNFVQNYIAYHYFRSKGWIVKPGLKFGGDFILYKKGPPFFHSSYIVIVQVYDSAMKPLVNTRQPLTWFKMGSLGRLSETTHKEVLVCQIVWPDLTEEQLANPHIIREFAVNEVLLRRWQATQERLAPSIS